MLRGEPFFRAPLYPYLLALVYSVSENSFVAPRIIQFILGGFTAVMTFTLARRLMGRMAGVVAGLLCAVYPVLIYFEGELLTETLFIFLTMLGILLLDIARNRKGAGTWFAAGLALGLALITRPSIGLFLPLALAGALIFSRPKAQATALLLAGMVLPVIPVAVHNYTVSGEFIPVVWQGGINFYLGNNPAADGWSATGPEIRKDWWGGYRDMVAIPRHILGREPTFGEVSDFWSSKGWEFIKGQPGQWLRLMLKKAALFWSSMEFPNNQDYNFMKTRSWVLRNPVVNFGTVAPLSLLGLFLLLRRRKRLFFPYVFTVAYFTGTIAFFVCARYRSPALPVMCLFAGGAVAYLIGLARTGRLVSLSLSIIALIPLVALVNVNLTGESLPDLAQSWTQVGKVYMERGDDDAASEHFHKAIESNPAWAEAYEQLGLLAMKVGDKEEAKELLARAVRILPDMATAHRSLAMLHLSLNDLDKARQSAEEAVRHAPYLEDTRNLLGTIERQRGDLDRAVAYYEEELEINPGSWRALANLGSVYEERGDLDRSAEAYALAMELNPDSPDILMALASVQTKRGEHEEARRLLEKIGSRLPQDINLRYNRAVILQNDGETEEARQMYENILASAPFHEGSLINLGVIYARTGRSDEARQLWLKALEINPANETARRNLGLLEERSPDEK